LLTDHMNHKFEYLRRTGVGRGRVVGWAEWGPPYRAGTGSVTRLGHSV